MFQLGQRPLDQIEFARFKLSQLRSDFFAAAVKGQIGIVAGCVAFLGVAEIPQIASEPIT